MRHFEEGRDDVRIDLFQFANRLTYSSTSFARALKSSSDIRSGRSIRAARFAASRPFVQMYSMMPTMSFTVSELMSAIVDSSSSLAAAPRISRNLCLGVPRLRRCLAAPVTQPSQLITPSEAAHSTTSLARYRSKLSSTHLKFKSVKPRCSRSSLSLPQAGCRGRSPRRGYRGCPPVPQTLEGGQVGQRRPPSQTLR